MSRAARRFSLLPSTLPLSLPRSPSAPPAGATLAQHPSLRRSRPCADQTNFARLSPGVGCCFRALHSLTHSLTLSLPFGLVSFFLYRPHYLSLSTRVSFSFYFALQLTEPDETSLPSFSRVSPIRCCIRAVKYA